MTDWATISSLATAAGTLVLAAATFGSTRSANRAARTAERAMLAGLRPLLLSARPQDRPEKVMWGDEHYAMVESGRGVFEQVDGVIYMATNLRNAGSGIAVLRGWYLTPTWDRENWQAQADARPPAPEEFRRQTRDLFIPPGDTGFWQAAIREPDDPLRVDLPGTLDRHERFMLDLLYGDYEGGQRTITRFGFAWHTGAEAWIASTSRHWNIDRQDPR
jgi:hypothetical protein